MPEETTKESGTKGSEKPAAESTGPETTSIDDTAGDARLTAIAAAVAAAVTAVRSEDQPVVTPVTGRGPWDTLSEFIEKLFYLFGKSVIYLIVLALLAIGWYFLEQQQSEKEKFLTAQQLEKEKFFTKQLQELEKQRNEAFGLVQSAYKDITGVAAQQILNLDNSLSVWPEKS